MNETIDTEKSLDHHKTAKHHLAPVFVLLVLTPLVSELLLGDIAPNASLPFLLLVDMLYYGTGAILIREIVRRRGLHWSWIPVLAFAYGLVEEGLALHSLFNPNFPGIGSLGFYGRAIGVDWVWASFVLGLHTVWSISVPILLVELLFPKYRQDRWLGNIGFSIDCIVFVLGMGLLTFIYARFVTPDFKPSPIAMVVTAILALAIILTVLFVPVRAANLQPQSGLHAATNPWLLGIVATLLGGIFLFVHEFFSPAIPALLAILFNIVLAVVAVLLIRSWSAPDRLWDDRHRIALAFAALLGYCAFGFEVASPDVAKMIFHGILSLITIILMILFTLKVSARVRATL
jgi:hypothetical protein